MIAPGIKRQSLASRQNAVEERDVLLRFEEAGHALILRAMLLGNERRAVDLPGISDLGGIGIALEKEWLRPSAAGAQRREKQCKREQTRSGAIMAA